MSELTHTSSIPIPKDCSDPIGELEIFLRTNGYLIQIDADSLSATRGEKGKGFWTSDLTVLPTSVKIKMKDNQAEVEYRVDTTGQILNDEERQFWPREVQAAGSFIAGGSLENLKEAQKFQASEIRSRFFKRGMTLSISIAFVLFIVGVLVFK